LIDWDDFAQFAKDEDDRRARIGKATVTGLGAAYVGQQTIRSGVPRLLGVRLESHSTSNQNARQILKNGGIIDPSKSGTGAIRSIEAFQGINGVTDVEKAKGKVYITGVRSDLIARPGLPDPNKLDPLTQVAIRRQQRLGYRAQASIDWDKVNASVRKIRDDLGQKVEAGEKITPSQARNTLKNMKQEVEVARNREVLRATIDPTRGRSLYIGGSDDYFQKNFKPDFDDPFAQYSENKIKVYGNRAEAAAAAIKREGLLNLMKANKGRVAAGAAILGIGGLVTANLAKSAIDTIQSDGSVKGYKRRTKSGRITLVRGFKRQLAGGKN
jgi:hypothetical protein